MNKHLILCPVDYSESTESAISVAVDLAKVNHSKVILLHVVDPSGPPLSVGESSNHQFLERMRDQYLELNHVEFEHVNRRGDPADITNEFALKNKVDLIVMGTHGRTGLASVIVGSVAKSVMAGASCPVITVKMPVHSASK